jgi:hypothetical protein
MAGMDKHSGCPAWTGSGFPLVFGIMVVVVAPFGNNPLDNKAGTAEIVPGKFPDAHDCRCQVSFGKLAG